MDAFRSLLPLFLLSATAGASCALLARSLLAGPTGFSACCAQRGPILGPMAMCVEPTSVSPACWLRAGVGQNGLHQGGVIRRGAPLVLSPVPRWLSIRTTHLNSEDFPRYRRRGSTGTMVGRARVVLTIQAQLVDSIGNKGIAERRCSRVI